MRRAGRQRRSCLLHRAGRRRRHLDERPAAAGPDRGRRARDSPRWPTGGIRGQAVGVYLEVYGRAGRPFAATVSFGIADRADGETARQSAGIRCRSRTRPARVDGRGAPGHQPAAARRLRGGRHHQRRQAAAWPPDPAAQNRRRRGGGRRRRRRCRSDPARPLPVDATSNVVKSFARTDVLSPDALTFSAAGWRPPRRRPCLPALKRQRPPSAAVSSTRRSRRLPVRRRTVCRSSSSGASPCWERGNSNRPPGSFGTRCASRTTSCRPPSTSVRATRRAVGTVKRWEPGRWP